MPNWVSTQLSVRGSHNELVRFREGIKGNAILESYIPTPQELRDTMNGFTADEEKMEELRKKQEANKAKYGYPDWYEWQYDTWGTKWGDCDTHVEDVTGTELIAYFMTAWGPATKGFLSISKMFPELMFVLRYDEEAGFFAGIEAIKNGEVIFEEMYAPTEYGEGLDWNDEESYEKYEEYKNERMEKIETLFEESVVSQ